MVRPVTYDGLVSVLQERLPSLTRSQKLLAERVMADPEGVAFMTVTDLASAVGVNESTVVRFATGLGLEGYPGLTRVCRERLRAQAQLVRRFGNVERMTQGAGDPLEIALGFEHANITRSLSGIDRKSWAKATKKLASAPRVHVLGMRKCHSVAYLLGYLLRMVRDEVATLSAGQGTLPEELRRVRRGDVFVTIGIHRYSRDTVRAFERAKKVKATTITLTDNPSSPLAAGADHVFYVETTGVAVLRSVTGFVAVAQAMANAVAAQRGVEARSALASEEELLIEFDVYDQGAEVTPSRSQTRKGAST